MSDHQKELDKARRLVAHRELQFLRATAVRSKGGRSWVRARARKLADARAYLARLEARDPASGDAA